MEGAHSGAPLPAKQYAQVAESVAEYNALAPAKLAQKIKKLEQKMYEHARNLEFEEAARLRDEIHRVKQSAIKTEV